MDSQTKNKILDILVGIGEKPTSLTYQEENYISPLIPDLDPSVCDLYRAVYILLTKLRNRQKCSDVMKTLVAMMNSISCPLPQDDSGSTNQTNKGLLFVGVTSKRCF
jgi:hypothetical protein